MKPFLYLMFAWSIAGAGYASVPTQISTEELYSKSADVADIVIEKAEMINVGNVQCGARYTGKVLEDLKGDRTQIVFEGANGLEIGGEYLFFFKRHEQRSSLNSSPEQIASCPAPVAEMTPDYSRGIIKVRRAANPARSVFEVYGQFIRSPSFIQSAPPLRYKADEFYGTVWLDREDLLKYLRSLKAQLGGGT